MAPRLVILAGPSCVGKGPLVEALARSRPDLRAGLKDLILFNSRSPRPIEREGEDYYFRPRAEIEAMRGREGFLVVEARADLHALELAQAESVLARGESPFFEGNAFVACRLLDWAAEKGLKPLSIFLSPLSESELAALRARGEDMTEALARIMEPKLRRRALRQKGKISEEEAADLRVRARSAFRELRDAWRFDRVLPNHDGEDSGRWDAVPPSGEAGQVLAAFAALLEGKVPPLAERWKPRGLD